jgi:glutathione S-transferase
MKLYWCPKSRSFRALWMLEEIGRPYERALIDIRSDGQNDAEFRAANPMAKVPALADGPAKLGESAAICAYLAERFPEARLAPPLGDPARARYLYWLFYSPACIEPAFTQKFTGFELPTRAAGWGSFERVISVLDEALAEGPWILGEKFSAADVMIGSDLFYGMETFKIVEPKPAFAAYVARCKARPAMQRALAIDAGST